MSTLKMPRIDRQTLKNKDKILRDLSDLTKRQKGI